MAENEQQQKKKPRTMKPIFKWIGLGLLSLLIIAATFFHAPWKVITLLLIILAACTALPKPARKWFWLTTAVVVMALIIWILLPDSDSDEWKPYTFDEELGVLEAEYTVPDPENAATIYDALLQEYDPNAMYPHFLDADLDRLTRSEPWSSQNYPQIAGWLKGHQSTIETLLEASKIEKCRFPIAVDFVNYNQLMKRLSAMRQWAFLLGRAANNDLGDARIDQALKKSMTMLQMARHQSQQPTIPDMLTGIALEALATREFNRFIVTGAATEEHLNMIQEGLAGIKHNWGSDLTRVLEYELWSAKRELVKYYEVNRKGEIRLSRDPWAQARAQWKQQLENNQIENPRLIEILKSRAYLTYRQKKFIRARTILHWFLLPSVPQKATKIIDENFQKCYEMARPDFNWEKEPGLTFRRFSYFQLTRRLARMSEKMYYRLHDLYLRAVRGQRGSQILIGLRRYKNKNANWPQSLDEVKLFVPAGAFVDPTNRGAFAYKTTEQDFTLYSKGENNIDEGGRRGYVRALDKHQDDIAIWPLTERETGGPDNE